MAGWLTGVGQVAGFSSGGGEGKVGGGGGGGERQSQTGRQADRVRQTERKMSSVCASILVLRCVCKLFTYICERASMYAANASAE